MNFCISVLCAVELAALTYAAMNLVSIGKYTKLPEKTCSNILGTKVMKSLIRCGGACEAKDSCQAYSWDAKEKICTLCDGEPLQQIQPDHNLYYRQEIPGSTMAFESSTLTPIEDTASTTSAAADLSTSASTSDTVPTFSITAPQITIANHHVYYGFIYYRANHSIHHNYYGFIYYRANHSIHHNYYGFIYYRANHSIHHNYYGSIYYRANHSNHHPTTPDTTSTTDPSTTEPTTPTTTSTTDPSTTEPTTPTTTSTTDPSTTEPTTPTTTANHSRHNLYYGFIYYRANHSIHHIYYGSIYKANDSTHNLYYGFIYYRANHSRHNLYYGSIYYRANHSRHNLYYGSIYYRANHSNHHICYGSIDYRTNHPNHHIYYGSIYYRANHPNHHIYYGSIYYRANDSNHHIYYGSIYYRANHPNHHIYYGSIYYRANHLNHHIYYGSIYYRANHLNHHIYYGSIYYRVNHSNHHIYYGSIYYRANHSNHQNSLSPCVLGILHNGICYTKLSGTKSWHGGVQACKDLGGDMISVASQEEVDFLQGWSDAPSEFWIGIKYNATTGRRSWTDGSPYSFEMFKEGLLFDVDPQTAGNQRVFMKSKEQYWERKADGSEEKGIICKSLAVDGSVCQTSSGITRRLRNGICYTLLHTLKTWVNGETYCRGLGGHLLSVTSQDELEFLHLENNFPEYGINELWLGLRYNATSIGLKYWTDGSPYTFDAFLSGLNGTKTARKRRRQEGKIMGKDKVIQKTPITQENKRNNLTRTQYIYSATGGRHSFSTVQLEPDTLSLRRNWNRTPFVYGATGGGDLCVLRSWKRDILVYGVTPLCTAQLEPDIFVYGAIRAGHLCLRSN
ncbi:unnamed protein product [Cyprideis torosa]|uniref:Uncharacterized protein n=1 Tax=Cyprideis torosa TaxID=163714 RepID=A0A7R8WCS5_9CRUS|nr:unnamed protein product [Cyprideis torosa]CAG0893831.1 unnamed protein product [Cyprideis torosa]